MNYDIVVELLCFLIVAAAIFFHLQSNFAHWSIRDVNGPPPIPLFGNFKKVLFGNTPMEVFLQKIYQNYSKERVVGIFSGAEPILLLRDPDLINDVLVKDLSAFADHGLHAKEKIELFAGKLFTLEPDKWRMLRRKMSTVFSSGRLKDMLSLLDQCGDQFAKYLEKLAADGGLVSCNKVASKYITSTIGSYAFGLNAEKLDDNEFVRNAENVMKSSRKMSLIEKLKYIEPWMYNFFGYHFADYKSSKYFINLIVSAIKERKEERIVRHDFIDFLLDLKEHSEKMPGLELTDECLAAQVMLFFISGFHSSSITMSYALYELARNQDIQEELRAEIKNELEKNNGYLDVDCISNMTYLELIFKETLRKYTPLAFLMRRTLQSYRFTGTKIVVPKGQLIWIPVYPIHHDPNVYPAPEVFDPERFRNGNFESAHLMSYLAFGDGSGNCIGSQFAITQTKVGLIKILLNYKVDLFEGSPVKYTCKGRQFASMPENIILKINKIIQD